jgi:hypothetical protein
MGSNTRKSSNLYRKVYPRNAVSQYYSDEEHKRHVRNILAARERNKRATKRRKRWGSNANLHLTDAELELLKAARGY